MDCSCNTKKEKPHSGFFFFLINRFSRTDMATSSRPFASFDTKLASGWFGSSNVSRSGRGCRCFRDNRGEQYNPLVHCNVDVRIGFRILLTGEIGR